jgi:hypothetical protein
MNMDNWANKLRVKLYGLIILATCGALAVAVHGQEAAPPAVDLYEGQDQPEAAVTPPLEPNGPELPEIEQMDQIFKPRSLGKDADAMRVHIEWRQLKNRTVNDPAVQAAKAYAQAARTDLEKRNRLRQYYEIYYQRMSALATTPEIKLALQQLKSAHENILAQPRVRPSPTPEGATPTATATPKKQAHKNKKNKLKK